MDFNLSEQQKMLQTLAKEIAQKEIEPHAANIDQVVTFPPEVTEILRQNRLFGLLVSEDYDGEGTSLSEFCLMIEEISKVCPASAVMCTIQNLGSRLILRNGTEEQCQKYVPKLVSGEAICGIALKDPVGRDEAELVATRKGDNYVINGTRHFITNGDIADIILLLARSDADNPKDTCLVLEKGTPGFSVEIEEGITGCQSRYMWVGTFKDCQIPARNVIGQDGDGIKVADSIMAETGCATAARAIGLTQNALDYALDYSKERVVFGRPVSQFEGVQIMLVNGSTRIEAARQLLYKAASLVDEGSGDARKFAAMTKYFACDMATDVTIDAVEIMGGSGLMTEFPLERAMRNAALTKMTEGSSVVQEITIASFLL